MASLQDLLDEEGFRRRNPKKAAWQKGKTIREDSISLPIYICYDGKGVGLLQQRPEKKFRQQGSSLKSFPRDSSKRIVSKSGLSNSRRQVSLDVKRAEPAIDEVAVQAVMSILGGHIGRFVKDADFRNRIREACKSCLADKDSEDEIIANMELGMEKIDTFAESSQGTGEARLSLLSNSVRLLTVVASLNSSHTKTALTCGIPNSDLSACAQLYLSIVYKLEKNDRSSAKHLLQVFCDSPSLARRTLLPELWEHFFLPHLLHLKVWYNKEMEFISNARVDELERRMKLLNKVYNEHMDIGTSKFALYYKEWLKVGGQAPAVPSVPLPTRSSYEFACDLSGSSSSRSSIRQNLYQDGFGNFFMSAPEVSGSENDGFVDVYEKDCHLPERESLFTGERETRRLDNHNLNNPSQMDSRRCNRLPVQKYEELKVASVPEVNRYQYIQFFPCHSKPPSELCSHGHENENRANTRKPAACSFVGLDDAITVICTSDDLSNCEIAVRFVAKTWLDSQGNAIVETAISKTPVIEGLLEVLFSSEDDEILQLIISVLAELVVRNDNNRWVILNIDAELEIFMRLLKKSTLFLKTIVFLYLLRPQAKQLCSSIWIPLFLKVMEYGDQIQTLFTNQCSPQAAVLYFLNLFMTGFDAERNLENVKLVIMVGGLKFLLKRLEVGSTQERKTAVSLLLSCIQADGKCRNYMAKNIKKTSLLALFLNERQKFGAPALHLLTELLCLHRRAEINKFLTELKNEGSLNTMHILLSYLQQAPVECRPVVAAILLLLDLVGDPLKSSLFREEAMDTIVTALHCNSNSSTVQEQMSKALSLLGGKFSYTGEASVGSWLLKKAASNYEFTGKVVVHKTTRLDEEEGAMESWIQKAATALLSSGRKRFLTGLSKAIANGIPCLSHASLVTVASISSSRVLLQNADFGLMATAVLKPCLMENLNLQQNKHGKLLSSLALANLARNSGGIQGQIMLPQSIEE